MTTDALSPECRLVFRSADPAATDEEFVVLTAAVHDWSRALMLAEREQATSALWRWVCRARAIVPAPVAEHLRRSAMISDFRMQRLAERTRHTVAALADAGLSCVLLKGAALGASSDPTFCARPMTDVDLLVQRAEVDRAAETVVRSGWPQTTDPVLVELLRSAHHLPHFLDPLMPGVRLELHVALLPDDHSFAFDERDVWRDATPAPAPFTGAWVPSIEHQLLHACVHFAWQHSMQFGAWRTFRTIAMTLARTPVDWTRFAAVAHAARAATACHWSLRLAARLSAIPIPSTAIAALAAPTPAWVCAGIERHFIADIAIGESPVSPSQRLTRFLWLAALRPRWSGHRRPGRLDSLQRWERARGTLSDESTRSWLLRHARSYREYWRFFSRTLAR